MIWEQVDCPEYVLIVTGSRDLKSDRRHFHMLKEMRKFRRYPYALFEGDAAGVDHFLKEYFEPRMNENNIIKFPADWKTHGKAAGFIRNQEMLDSAILYADGVDMPLYYLAFPAPESKGALDMIARLEKAKIPGLISDLPENLTEDVVRVEKIISHKDLKIDKKVISVKLK